MLSHMYDLFSVPAPRICKQILTKPQDSAISTPSCEICGVVATKRKTKQKKERKMDSNTTLIIITLANVMLASYIAVLFLVIFSEIDIRPFLDKRRQKTTKNQ